MTSLLIRNARLVPIGADDQVPDGPVDVAIEDGVVTAVGYAAERPAGAEVVDAAGRWLMPGLWDQHVHLGQWTLASARLDLGPARSCEEAVALVRERLEQWPDLPVIGWGHRPTAWPDNPTVSVLDAIGTDVGTLTPDRVNDFVANVYESAFEILQALGEAEEAR